MHDVFEDLGELVLRLTAGGFLAGLQARESPAMPDEVAGAELQAGGEAAHPV